MKAMQPEQAQQPIDPPTQAEWDETMASAEQKRSAAALNYAKADQAVVETQLAPQQAAQQADAARMKAQQPFGA